MTTTIEKSTSWAACVAAEAHQAATYSVGLMSGSRFVNDRRAIDRLLRAASTELSQLEFGASSLLVRLDVNGELPETAIRGNSQIPDDFKSPLGPWHEVTLSAVGSVANERLATRLAEWLPQWKQQHRLVVIDLGPMHLAACRNIGRLCDVCYLVLGPGTCASHEWIMEQLEHHDNIGTVVAGSLVATNFAA